MQTNQSHLDLYINITPLFDEQYTGVSNYARAIIEEALKDRSRLWNFFYESFCVQEETLHQIINGNSSERRNIKNRIASIASKPLNYSETSEIGIGIFFRTRHEYSIFKHELEFVHDLSFILGPEWHDGNTVKIMTPAFIKSIQANAKNLCVSQSTAKHLQSYLGVSREQIEVVGCAAFLGVQDRVGEVAEPRYLPYILILGTVEPRKNLGLIFRLLRRYPWILKHYQFCFVGDHGWGPTLAEIARDEGISIDSIHRSVFSLGYLDEEKKITVIKNARFSIYPSFFEGFGMPALESLMHGVPAVVSYSTSLPEVCGEAGYYFDPFSEDSLMDAIVRLQNDLLESESSVRERCIHQARKFKWQNVYNRLVTSIGEFDK